MAQASGALCSARPSPQALESVDAREPSELVIRQLLDQALDAWGSGGKPTARTKLEGASIYWKRLATCELRAALAAAALQQRRQQFAFLPTARSVVS